VLAMLLFRHEELLSDDNGVYATMWTQQQTKLAEEERRKMSQTDDIDSAVAPDMPNSLRHGH